MFRQHRHATTRRAFNARTARCHRVFCSPDSPRQPDRFSPSGILPSSCLGRRCNVQQADSPQDLPAGFSMLHTVSLQLSALPLLAVTTSSVLSGVRKNLLLSTIATLFSNALCPGHPISQPVCTTQHKKHCQSLYHGLYSRT